MKFSLLKAVTAVLAGVPSALAVIRAEDVSDDGVVHVTFSNFTNPDVILNANETTALERRQRPNAFKFVQCKDEKTYWDHWWYSAGPILVCGKGQKCSIARGEGKTVGWSVSGTAGLDFPKLLEFAFKLGGSWTFQKSVTTTVTQTINWDGPASNRLWLKQSFSVTEATCRSCYGSNPGAPDYYCNGFHYQKGWIPCSNDDCYAYSVSDAYAKCDKSNNCEIS